MKRRSMILGAVVVTAVLSASGCGESDTGSNQSTPPSSVSQTAPSSAAPTTSSNAAKYLFRNDYLFQSENGGYACGILAPASQIDGRGAGCHGTTSPVPPRPADCSTGAGWGRGMQVSPIGVVSFLCTGGVIYASGYGDAPVLYSGDSLSALGFECTSTEEGVKCTQTSTGHGFVIEPERNETF